MKDHTIPELKAIAVKEYSEHPERYSQAYIKACYELANRGVGHVVASTGKLVFNDMKGGEYGTA